MFVRRRWIVDRSRFLSALPRFPSEKQNRHPGWQRSASLKQIWLPWCFAWIRMFVILQMRLVWLLPAFGVQTLPASCFAWHQRSALPERSAVPELAGSPAVPGLIVSGFVEVPKPTVFGFAADSSPTAFAFAAVPELIVSESAADSLPTVSVFAGVQPAVS